MTASLRSAIVLLRTAVVLASLLALITIAHISSAQAASGCPRFNTLPAAIEGRLGYDLTTKYFYVCDGTSWVMVF